MSELRFEALQMSGAEVGPENPLPPLGRQSRRAPDREKYEGFSDGMLERMGYGHPANYLPYTLQDRYTRQRQLREWPVAVLENEILRAEFLLSLGGRLRSLVHKPSGRELLECNPVLQPANLAVRNAWFSGGTEWNIGMLGHHPLTCSPMFAARAEAPDGTPTCLRMWEWERLRQTPYQIDAWLPPGSPMLLVRIRITNPLDETVPMYWWSNTAVPESEDTRVIVSADEAYNFGYGDGGPARVKMPIVQGVDVSYVTNAPRAADFFYHVPTESGQRPWVSSLDGSGRGLVQTSTDLLKGRKLFFWGMGAGGRRWQEWLSEPGHRYLEIQAGLARTQMEHLPMPPQTDWTWLEGYGLMEADAGAVHASDWSVARTEVEQRLEQLVPRAQLDETLAAAEASSARPPLEIMQVGGGWGALEAARRDGAGEGGFHGSGVDFIADSLTEAQTPWMWLLLEGELPPSDAADEPVSYLVQSQWRELLQASLDEGRSAHWSAWYHLGLMRYAAAGYIEARAAWQRSLACEETIWAHRCLARLADEEGNVAEAVGHYARACQLRRDVLPLLIEAGAYLVDHEQESLWLELVGDLPQDMRAAGRVRLLEARACLATEDLRRVEAILNDTSLAIDDLREGERSLSHLWFEMQEKRLSKAEGIAITEALKQRVQRECPVPAHLDFRMQ